MNRDGGPGLADLGRLLPTPRANDMTGSRTEPRPDGKSLALNDVAVLLPTPNASDAVMGRPRTSGRPVHSSTHLPTIVTVVPGVRDDPKVEGFGDELPRTDDRRKVWSPFNHEAWGPYAVAVARWSLLLGREAPAPVAPNRNGRPALTAEFAEWMMGLPAGWITGNDLGLSRSNCLKLAGNGVVPQAAHFAYSALLSN